MPGSEQVLVKGPIVHWAQIQVVLSYSTLTTTFSEPGTTSPSQLPSA